jgi:hypothetical protein
MFGRRQFIAPGRVVSSKRVAARFPIAGRIGSPVDTAARLTGRHTADPVTGTARYVALFVKTDPHIANARGVSSGSWVR